MRPGELDAFAHDSLGALGRFECADLPSERQRFDVAEFRLAPARDDNGDRDDK